MMMTTRTRTTWPQRSTPGDEDDDDDTHMDVARVYEHTIVKLGEVLAGGGGIGDIGDVAEVDEVDEY